MFREVSRCVDGVGPFCRYVDLDDGRETLVDGFIVHVDDVLAFLTVRRDDRFLQLADGQVQGDDVCQFEEGRLHDHVDAAAESNLLGNTDGVDDIELDVVAGNGAF